MPILTLEQIAEANDRNRETIPVPEWGGDVVMQVLTEQQIVDVTTKATVDGKLDETLWRRLVLAETIVEPDLGESHVGVLAGKNGAVVLRLSLKAIELNGLGKEPLEQAEASFPEEPAESPDVPVGA